MTSAGNGRERRPKQGKALRKTVLPIPPVDGRADEPKEQEPQHRPHYAYPGPARWGGCDRDGWRGRLRSWRRRRERCAALAAELAAPICQSAASRTTVHDVPAANRIKTRHLRATLYPRAIASVACSEFRASRDRRGR